jgi:hypothetical protein
VAAGALLLLPPMFVCMFSALRHNMQLTAIILLSLHHEHLEQLSGVYTMTQLLAQWAMLKRSQYESAV